MEVPARGYTAGVKAFDGFKHLALTAMVVLGLPLAMLTVLALD